MQVPHDLRRFRGVHDVGDVVVLVATARVTKPDVEALDVVVQPVRL